MISLVFRENSFILMSSCIHLQCNVLQSSLTRLCKTVNGTPTYGRRQHKHAPLSRLVTALAQVRVPVAFLTRPGTLALLGNR